jgi:hypothetical protein
MHFTKSFVRQATTDGSNNAGLPQPVGAPAPMTTARIQPQHTKANYEQFHLVVAKHYANECEHVTAEFLDTCRRVFAGLQQPSKYVTNLQLQEILSVGPGGLVGLVLGGASLQGDQQTSDNANVERQVRNAVRIASSIVKDGLHEDMSTQKALRQISSQSYVHSEELAYVHLWHCRREGRKFQQILRSLAAVRHRIPAPKSLCVPFSVAVAHQGRFITVTWMPPLIDELPVTCTNDGIIGTLDDAWRYACGASLTPQHTQQLGNRLSFHAGADGRYYTMTSCLPPLGDRNTDSSNACRYEHMVSDRSGADDDLRAVEIHVENALTRAAVNLGDIVTNEEKLREASPDLVTRVCRDAGLNKQFLFRLRNVMVQTLQNSGQDQAAGATVDMLDTEMIGRTLKSVVEAHLLMSIDESDGPFTLSSRLVVVNELMTIFFRNPEFLQGTLMPLMRMKFRATDAFVVHPSHLKLGMVARMLAERFGMTFDPKTRKFAAFLEDPVVLGHTARSAINSAEFYSGNKTLASRRTQDLLQQCFVVKVPQLLLPATPNFSFAPKMTPALYALSLALMSTAEAFATVASGSDKDFITTSSSGRQELPRTVLRQFYSGLAAYFGQRSQFLAADLASDSIVVENMIQREGNALGHAMQAAANRLNMIDVEHILSRVAECLRTSPEAVGMQSDAWTHVLLSVVERVCGSSNVQPISRDHEKALEVKTQLRRVLLSYFSECPTSGREIVKRLPDAVMRLALSFPKERLMPSLLLMAQASQFILLDDATANTEPLDQNDCNVLCKVWDELVAPSIPMWLMVCDACPTDAVFEETLGRLITEDEALTLLQFVVMVSSVGHVQKLLAEEHHLKVDRRKGLLEQFTSSFRHQMGHFHLEQKMEKVTEEVDSLIQPFE